MHANDDIRLFAALSRIEALLQEFNMLLPFFVSMPTLALLIAKEGHQPREYRTTRLTR